MPKQPTPDLSVKQKGDVRKPKESQKNKWEELELFEECA